MKLDIYTPAPITSLNQLNYITEGPATSQAEVALYHSPSNTMDITINPASSSEEILSFPIGVYPYGRFMLNVQEYGLHEVQICPWKYEDGSTAMIIMMQDGSALVARHYEAPERIVPLPFALRKNDKYAIRPIRTWTEDLDDLPVITDQYLLDDVLTLDAVIDTTPQLTTGNMNNDPRKPMLPWTRKSTLPQGGEERFKKFCIEACEALTAKTMHMQSSIYISIDGRTADRYGNVSDIGVIVTGDHAEFSKHFDEVRDFVQDIDIILRSDAFGIPATEQVNMSMNTMNRQNPRFVPVHIANGCIDHPMTAHDMVNAITSWRKYEDAIKERKTENSSRPEPEVSTVGTEMTLILWGGNR